MMSSGPVPSLFVKDFESECDEEETTAPDPSAASGSECTSDSPRDVFGSCKAEGLSKLSQQRWEPMKVYITGGGHVATQPHGSKQGKSLQELIQRLGKPMAEEESHLVPAMGTLLTDLTPHECAPAAAYLATVSNLPAACTEAMFLEEIQDAGFVKQRDFNFLYMPVHAKSKHSLGYCVVNFVDIAVWRSFMAAFTGRGLRNFDVVVTATPYAAQGCSQARIDFDLGMRSAPSTEGSQQVVTKGHFRDGALESMQAPRRRPAAIKSALCRHGTSVQGSAGAAGKPSEFRAPGAASARVQPPRVATGSTRASRALGGGGASGHAPCAQRLCREASTLQSRGRLGASLQPVPWAADSTSSPGFCARPPPR